MGGLIASEFRATCGVVQGRGGRIQSSYEGGCGRGGTTEIVPPKKALAKQRRPSHASMSTVAIPQLPLPHAIRYGASRNAPNIPTPPRPAARQHHRSRDVADDREMTDARRKGGGSSKSPPNFRPIPRAAPRERASRRLGASARRAALVVPVLFLFGL